MTPTGTPTLTAEERLAQYEDFLRRVARYFNGMQTIREIVGEAQVLVEVMPKPIDPDVLAVRKICAAESGVASGPYLRGERDEEHAMRSALAAYRAGRGERS